MPAPQTSSLLDRVIANIRHAWRGDGDGSIADRLKPDLPDADLAALRRQIDACLEGPGGEVSARLRAADLARGYLRLNDQGRRRFLLHLAERYDIRERDLNAAVTTYSIADSGPAKHAARAALAEALVSPRVKLLTQFNGVEYGVRFLIELRADLRRFRKEDPELADLDRDLHKLLAAWFDVGFLELQKITWRSPATLLEKLIDYEAVHAIGSWDDLKHRLRGDRCCYAFFHPVMPEEPLIFVEVALVDGIAGNVQKLLDPALPEMDSEQADTAIFYSISNCQPGLAGVSFGNFLIKRVVDRLRRDLPNARTFSTLSPIPGFARWLRSELETRGEAALNGGEHSEIKALSGNDDAATGLLALLERPDWYKDTEVTEAIRECMIRLCGRYLCSTGDKGRALDRVAHFHLANGARVERINWLADTSQRGRNDSFCMMVNYLYEHREIESNHEAYHGEGRIMTSPPVRRLAKGK
ncbi:malonyl-CoA decarboxylase domain-containing protein [Oceanibacterium hippocampi]|nr:malonyl-CoA decarboxylase family protein [Oceanibacterium hippocampi]